jgi:DNA polymerase-4
LNGYVKRWVLHLDMDAYFAAVEQLTRPTLRGRAVLVGGPGPRGTVAGANYEARAYGARSAMPMAEARRRCPHAVVLPPRFAVYHAVSERVFTLVRRAAPVLEQVALDEAFAEPPSLAGADAAEVEQFARQLRAQVREEVGLAASVGAGSGKQVAKIASGLAKPDGLRVVPHGTEHAFLVDLPVRVLWGVGPVAEGKLRRIGVNTVGQLSAMRVGDATSLLGQAVGAGLHRLAQGIDNHPVAERGDAKQVSAETTFDVDVADMSTLAAAVRAMAESAQRRLIGSGRAARTVTVKVRRADFSTISRSETMPAATTDQGLLVAVAQRLVIAAVPSGAVRLIGVSLSGLASAEQEPLFPAPGQDLTPAPAQTIPTPLRTGSPTGWRSGDDVVHPEHGHGWVQGCGVGRVTVRFETAATGPGTARTFAADDPNLSRADPLHSLAW